MPTVAVVTLILATLIIAKTLDALDGGVQVIVAKTATVKPVVASVNASLKPVRDFAESI